MAGKTNDSEKYSLSNVSAFKTDSIAVRHASKHQNNAFQIQKIKMLRREAEEKKNHDSCYMLEIFCQVGILDGFVYLFTGWIVKLKNTHAPCKLCVLG